MTLTITSATKTIFGLYEIKVKINKRSYTYQLSSEYAYDKAMKQYQAGQHGRCLAVLNKFGEL